MRSRVLQLCGSVAESIRTYAKPAGIGAGKRLGLKDVQHVVAVASGKGGVGKSTVAGDVPTISDPTENPGNLTMISEMLLDQMKHHYLAKRQAQQHAPEALYRLRRHAE